MSFFGILERLIEVYQVFFCWCCSSIHFLEASCGNHKFP